jgi:spermidine synthase
VEVRVTRRGRELRVDGTFASFYAPGQPGTGSVWDALAAPIAWLPPGRRRRILLLGLGGGSAARVARALAPGARIVGVERDREVLRAARRWFDLDAIRAEVIRADARAWLAGARGSFDAVLEDVFVGEGEAVHKPDWLPRPGLEQLRRLVAPGGLLASNALDEAPAVAGALAALFPAVARIDVADYDNRILVGGPAPLGAATLRAAAAASPVLRAALPRLSFRTLRRGLPRPRPGTAARLR